VVAFLVSALVMATGQPRPAPEPAPITIDYPAERSIFPPEFPAPMFLWRDAASKATSWVIEVTFADGSAGPKIKSLGERMRVGTIDPRCVGPTNKPPSLTPEQAAAHTWRPDAPTWAAFKKGSVERAAAITVTGYRDAAAAHRPAAAQRGRNQ
jgi:hypothetical protein